MANTHHEWLQDAENARAFAAEELILDVTEQVRELLEKHDISKSELAERLGSSKAHVSQLLNGSRNMTLRTLADIAYALGERVRIRFDSVLPNEDEWFAVESWTPARTLAVNDQDAVKEGEYGNGKKANNNGASD